jgi:hypothetical protein
MNDIVATAAMVGSVSMRTPPHILAGSVTARNKYGVQQPIEGHKEREQRVRRDPRSYEGKRYMYEGPPVMST